MVCVISRIISIEHMNTSGFHIRRQNLLFNTSQFFLLVEYVFVDTFTGLYMT